MIQNHLNYIAISTLLILLTACGSSDDDPCEGLVCTEEFRVEYVTVVNQNQEPVALDEFLVVNMELNYPLRLSEELTAEEFQLAREQGRYPLLTDSDLPPLQTTYIQFRGILNNEILIKEDYDVSADCCHILTPTGNLDITINN